MIRSAGLANLLNSEAAKNYEDARRKYIDNRVYGTDKYFEMREINRRARAAERRPRASLEDIIRYSNMRKPNRLSPSELDPLTGQIGWPALLRDKQFQTQRMELEKVFKERAAYGYLNPEQQQAAINLTEAMKARLKENINAYSPQLYAQTKAFLNSLSYEARLPIE